MPVVYHARQQRPQLRYRYYPKLLDMAREVDTLMVIVPGGAVTANMINAEVLNALGPNGILINMARGSVVDQAALLAALSDGTIAGAGLDVFEKEPHAPGALTELSNVVLTPHIGGNTSDSHVAMQDCVIANLSAFFAGKALPYRAGG